MSKILDWLTRRRENVALELTRKHLQRVTDTVGELKRTMKALLEDNLEDAKSGIDRLNKHEQEADTLRRTIAVELTKGEVPMKIREDLMHFSKRVDAIADYARNAGRHLAIILEVKMPKQFRKYMFEMTTHLKTSTIVLAQGLDALSEKPDETMDYISQVEELEQKNDEIYYNLKQLLPELGDQFNAGVLLLIRELIEDVEKATDNVEDAADLIRVLLISST